MAERFCGVPDDFAGGGVKPLTFGSPRARWSSGALRYSLDPAGCSGLTPLQVATEVADAFAAWQIASLFFVFTQVPTGGDITIQFGRQELYGDLGTVGGTLGVAWPPPEGSIYLDAQETWNQASLQEVLVHEIGHALGLQHSNDPASVMFPSTTGTAVVDGESTRAIQSMYRWQPQTPLSDRASSHGPALGVRGQDSIDGRGAYSMCAAWKGVAGDQALYWSTLAHRGWTPQERIEGTGSLHSPALCNYPAPGFDVPTWGLFMAWRGVADDSAIYWTQNPAFGWEPQRPINGVGTECGPALALHGRLIYMAWKGIEGDSGIYWSVFDGTSWSPQAQVPGVGTSDKPALVQYRDRIHMFWKGRADDSNVYWSALDPGGWRPQQRVSCVLEVQAGSTRFLDIGAAAGPGAALRGTEILLAWKGVVGDSGIYFSLFNGLEFTGQVRIPDVGTSESPAVCDLAGIMHMMWKGIDGDSGLYWSQL